MRSVRTSAKSRLIQTGNRDQVGAPLNALRQHVVGLAEASSTRCAAPRRPSSSSRWDPDHLSTTSRIVVPSGRMRPRCDLEVERARDDATVSAPISFLAISAITGRAAGAGAPPSPAVMKTMSAPFSASLRSSRDSEARGQAMARIGAAPRPWVDSWPMFS